MKIKVSIFLAVIFLLSAADALACTCIGPRTVIREFDDAKNVVVLKAVSYLRAPRTPDDYIGGFKFTVQKVYKGKLKPGQDLDVMGGGGCGPFFNSKDLGREFLIFFYSDDTSSAPGCGSTRVADFDPGAISYLDNMYRYRGLTRLSGVVSQEISTALEGEADRNVPLEGRTVRITGNGKDLRVKTDENGLFEVYGLTPGRYRIEPEKIRGYTIENDDNRLITAFTVQVFHKEHTEVNMRFEIYNEVRGMLLDDEGKPLAGVRLNLVPASGKPRKYFENTAYCANDGSFRFDEIPAGTYVIVGNPKNETSVSYPYPRFYFNGTGERTGAHEITIGPGERLSGFTVRAPRQAEMVTVSGKLLFEDGTPVKSELVMFKTGEEYYDLPGDALDYSEKDGSFKLKIIKGQKGAIFGSLYSYREQYGGCPDRLAAAQKTKDFRGDVKTPRLPLDANGDITGLELRFGFTLCAVR